MDDLKRTIGRTVAIMLWGIAASGAAYLLIHSLREGPIAGCGAGSGCDSVLKSHWAYFLPGVPVTAPALLTYGALIFALIFHARDQAWGLLIQTGALLVLGAALWFAGLQIFVIKALCKWCMGMHVSGGLGALCTLFLVRPVAREQRRNGALLAAAGLASLAGFQFFLPQKTTAQTELGAPGLAGNNRMVNVAGFDLDISQVPFKGNPAAAKRLLFLFDYTCSSCRRVHGYLSGAQDRFGKENYLVVMLPTPLNHACNQYYDRPTGDHYNACLFASMALALWWTDRDKFYEFDRWLIETGTPTSPPTADAARAKAEALIGSKDALLKALADPRVAAQLEQSTAIWSRVKSRTGRLAMPKILTSSGSLVEGAPENEQGIYELLEKSLGLVRVN